MNDESDDVEVVEDEVDSLELLSTGRVRFTLDGVKYTLRLPKHGEYKRLRLIIDPVLDDDGLPLARTQAEQITAVEDWVREVFKLLGDKPVPDNMEDSWPPWVFSGTLTGRLLVHWRDVPLAPGAPPAR